MNRPVAIALILLAAGSGFATGWLKPDAVTAARSAQTAGAGATETPAISTASAVSAEDAPPALPELTTVDDCREFLRTSGKLFAARHPLTRQAIRDFALRRWLELDAESALQEAERHPGNEYADTGFAPELFRVWLDLNVDSAIEGWTQANPMLAKNVRVAFLSALADKDPARAFALWETPRGKSESQHFDPAEEAIFQRWAQADPAGALAERDSAQVRGAWIDADPAAAYAKLKIWKDAHNTGWPPRADTAARLMPWLLANSPGEAAELVTIVTTGEQGSPFHLKTFAEAWLSKDPDGALRWARSQPPSSPISLELAFAGAQHVATSDPEAALELLRRLNKAAPTSGSDEYRAFFKNAAAREAFASLAATDNAKARELLAAEPELAKNGGLAGYLTHAFAGDTDAAIQQCREWLRDPALKEAAAAGAMTSFRWGHGAGARDPSELLAAIPEIADKVDADVLSGWAKANPTGAADFITERLRGGHDIEGLQSEGVLAELAISQPEYTGLWLQRLPDPELQAQAAKTLAANWSAFDPEAAAAWINSLPPGTLRDAAAREMAADQEGP